MEGWIDQLARALGEEPLSPAEVTRLLDVARDVAHQVERKITPLSTFLLGVAVGRSAGDADRDEKVDAALVTLREQLPDAPVQAGG